MNKIEIIKQIVQFHPTKGIEKGWAEYTGGMKDSGDWFWNKMVDVPDNDLSEFLNKLVAEKQIYDAITPVKTTPEEEKQAMTDFAREMEFKMWNK